MFRVALIAVIMPHLQWLIVWFSKQLPVFFRIVKADSSKLQMDDMKDMAHDDNKKGLLFIKIDDL